MNCCCEPVWARRNLSFIQDILSPNILGGAPVRVRSRVAQADSDHAGGELFIESVLELESMAAGEGGAPHAGWRPQPVLEGISTAGLSGNLLFVEKSASTIEVTLVLCVSLLLQ